MSAEPEGWIDIGHEREGIAVDAVSPSKHADHEVEETPRIGAGEEDGKPSDDDRYQGPYGKKEENDVVRDAKHPLDQWQPPVHLLNSRRLEVALAGRLVGR